MVYLTLVKYYYSSHLNIFLNYIYGPTFVLVTIDAKYFWWDQSDRVYWRQIVATDLRRRKKSLLLTITFFVRAIYKRKKKNLTACLPQKEQKKKKCVLRAL